MGVSPLGSHTVLRRTCGWEEREPAHGDITRTCFDFRLRFLERAAVYATFMAVPTLFNESLNTDSRTTDT